MSSSWQTYLPFVVIAVVFLLRLRNVKTARRMRLGRLLVGPIIVGLLAADLFFSVPPDTAGIAIFAGGLAAGAALGWQRARWMKVSFDPATGMFMLKQSPLALVLLIGVMVVRRLFLPGGSVTMEPGFAAAPHAMWIIDGLIGFGLGTISAQNVELYRRARTLRASMLAGVFV